MQRTACNANQTDCNSVMPYGIIIFYIPASIRDYYHMLHMGEGAMDCTCSCMKSRLKGICITGHQLQC